MAYVVVTTRHLTGRMCTDGEDYNAWPDWYFKAEPQPIILEMGEEPVETSAKQIAAIGICVVLLLAVFMGGLIWWKQIDAHRQVEVVREKREACEHADNVTECLLLLGFEG